MKHLDKLWLVVKDLWEIGGRLARITILIFLIWPIAMILTSLFAPQAVIALVTLLPLIGLVFTAVLYFNPLIFGAIAATPYGRTALSKLALVVGAELTLGAFFSVLPISNDRALLPLLLLVAIAAVFLAIGGAKKWIVWILVLATIFISAIIFLGGRSAAPKKASSILSSAEQIIEKIKLAPTPTPAPIPTPSPVAETPQSANSNHGAYIREGMVSAEDLAAKRGLALRNAQSAPICTDAEETTLSWNFPRADLELGRECWSGWIIFKTDPPKQTVDFWGRHRQYFYEATHSGEDIELFYLFPDGRIFTRADLLSKPVPMLDNRIRLMGKGLAHLSMGHTYKEAVEINSTPLYHPAPTPNRNGIRKNDTGSSINREECFPVAKTPRAVLITEESDSARVFTLIDGQVNPRGRSAVWWLETREKPFGSWSRFNSPSEILAEPGEENIFQTAEISMPVRVSRGTALYYMLVAQNECGTTYGERKSVEVE